MGSGLYRFFELKRNERLISHLMPLSTIPFIILIAVSAINPLNMRNSWP